MTAGPVRRAQLNTLEPIIITILIVIILGVTLLFFVRINRGEALERVETLKDQEDTATLSRMTHLPELACSQDVSAGTNCIDLEKARAFQTKFNGDAAVRQRYAYVFGTNSEVTIDVIDINGGYGAVEKIMFVTGTVGTEAKATTTYFVVHDPSIQKNRFAVMTIRRTA
jgi:hypothetical protein